MRARMWGLSAALGLLAAWGTVDTVLAVEPVAGASSLATMLGDGGSSGRDARKSASKAMPLDRMTEADRRAAEKILRNPTLYRRLPVESFTCDRALLEFSLAHPEIVVDIWRVLGISKVALDLTAPGQWRMSDGWGTEGTLRLLHHDRTAEGGTMVLLGQGGYTGPLSPQPLSGSCLLLVRYRPTGTAADGTAKHTMQVDAFLDADGVGLEIVTRTLQPLIVRSSASNLHEICQFMASLSSAAAENPEGVARLAGRMSKIIPADRQTFASLARDAGRGGSIALDPIAAEKLPAKLASRWLPARQLEGEQIR